MRELQVFACINYECVAEEYFDSVVVGVGYFKVVNGKEVDKWNLNLLKLHGRVVKIIHWC